MQIIKLNAECNLGHHVIDRTQSHLKSDMTWMLVSFQAKWRRIFFYESSISLSERVAPPQIKYSVAHQCSSLPGDWIAMEGRRGAAPAPRPRVVGLAQQRGLVRGGGGSGGSGSGFLLAPPWSGQLGGRRPLLALDVHAFHLRGWRTTTMLLGSVAWLGKIFISYGV
jgi:hypothetical protein